ncbi:hypothetical protein DFH07DRAFT_1001141 [Mycena maculata]|uniref:Secreted protein n=1 Tax=Mycena maculata TaxID=230809 RepID=A0AAD7JSX3_9AGAR|nr:hypothetical protein DFH07DRAFT_1001141 [Mycena maculata]
MWTILSLAWSSFGTCWVEVPVRLVVDDVTTVDAPLFALKRFLPARSNASVLSSSEELERTLPHLIHVPLFRFIAYRSVERSVQIPIAPGVLFQPNHNPIFAPMAKNGTPTPYGEPVGVRQP